MVENNGMFVSLIREGKGRRVIQNMSLYMLLARVRLMKNEICKGNHKKRCFN